MDEKEQLFTILQVSERLKIAKHTLRFWEKELGGLVAPLRTSGGQRRYTEQNVTVLEEVKRYRELGWSLPEISQRIASPCAPDGLEPAKIDLLASRVADVVKSEVYNFFVKEENG